MALRGAILSFLGNSHGHNMTSAFRDLGVLVPISRTRHKQHLKGVSEWIIHGLTADSDLFIFESAFQPEILA